MNTLLESPYFAQRAAQLGLEAMPSTNCMPGADVSPKVGMALVRDLREMERPVLQLGWIDPYFCAITVGGAATGVTIDDVARGALDGFFPHDRASEKLRPIAEVLRAQRMAGRIEGVYVDLEDQANWDNLDLSYDRDRRDGFAGLRALLRPPTREALFVMINTAAYASVCSLLRCGGMSGGAALVLGCCRAGQGWGDADAAIPAIPNVVRSHLAFTTGRPAELARMPRELKMNGPHCGVSLNTAVGAETLKRQLDICGSSGLVDDAIVFPEAPGIAAALAAMGSAPEAVKDRTAKDMTQRHLDALAAAGMGTRW